MTLFYYCYQIYIMLVASIYITLLFAIIINIVLVYSFFAVNHHVIHFISFHIAIIRTVGARGGQGGSVSPPPHFFGY